MGSAPESGSRSVVELTSAQLRALAHPLRARLLSALRMDGPSTATRLAERLDSNTGATSYHLRVLADHELVLEESSRGRGRERYWRSAHDVTRWQPGDFTDPADAASVDWTLRLYARDAFAWLQTWLDEWREWPTEWQRASTQSDYRLSLQPEQLRELVDEIHTVIERYAAAAAPEDVSDAQADQPAERVTVLFHAFPARRLPL